MLLPRTHKSSGNSSRSSRKSRSSESRRLSFTSNARQGVGKIDEESTSRRRKAKSSRWAPKKRWQSSRKFKRFGSRNIWSWTTYTVGLSLESLQTMELSRWRRREGSGRWHKRTQKRFGGIKLSPKRSRTTARQILRTWFSMEVILPMPSATMQMLSSESMIREEELARLNQNSQRNYPKCLRMIKMQ